MAEIFIIDDDAAVCRMLAQMVQTLGHRPSYALSLKEGVEAVSIHDFDVVLLDVNLPDGSGLDAVPRIREATSEPEVLIITGMGDPDGAELAVRSGAWAYVEKPIALQRMALQLARVLEFREMKKARRNVVVLDREGIVGESPKLKACLEVMAQAAGGDAGVLITGETGTGKELFARAIHRNSRRAEGPFVVVDCSTIPETLVESLLFGHERGAFTGADRMREGLIRQADGGTLFLDEIGELPLPVQRAFLRVLQERRFRPLGAGREVASDFRLVSATNQKLEDLVSQGRFRQDLFFRIKSFVIELPPLRERAEDIEELARNHTVRLAREYRTEIKGFSGDFFDVLAAYDWPGNVRELFHALERAFAAALEDPTLFTVHLPANIRARVARNAVASRAAERIDNIPLADGAPVGSVEHYPTLKEVRAATESRYLRDLMEAVAWDVPRACRLSGLSRSRLYDLLKWHGIEKSR